MEFEKKKKKLYIYVEEISPKAIV
uniref:Uncharacterized protein n=1 Tax=Lepeophtheirus salmonis TaxID=72036 RepID=A0A0K2T6K4_LEPSM